MKYSGDQPTFMDFFSESSLITLSKKMYLLRTPLYFNLSKRQTTSYAIIKLVLNFICLLGLVFVPLENFTTQMVTPPLPVKGCKIRPMFGTQGH